MGQAASHQTVAICTPKIRDAPTVRVTDTRRDARKRHRCSDEPHLPRSTTTKDVGGGGPRRSDPASAAAVHRRSHGESCWARFTERFCRPKRWFVDADVAFHGSRFLISKGFYSMKRACVRACVRGLHAGASSQPTTAPLPGAPRGYAWHRRAAGPAHAQVSSRATPDRLRRDFAPRRSVAAQQQRGACCERPRDPGCCGRPCSMFSSKSPRFAGIAKDSLGPGACLPRVLFEALRHPAHARCKAAWANLPSVCPSTGPVRPLRPQDCPHRNSGPDSTQQRLLVAGAAGVEAGAVCGCVHRPLLRCESRRDGMPLPLPPADG
jgi:hypothetical protein